MTEAEQRGAQKERRAMSDGEMLDFLEEFINREGGILLHDGRFSHAQLPGLGLRPGNLNRSLREAIQQCRKPQARAKRQGGK